MTNIFIYLCIINHPNEKKHNIINIKSYDSLCKKIQILIVFIVLIVKKIYGFFVGKIIKIMILLIYQN